MFGVAPVNLKGYVVRMKITPELLRLMFPGANAKTLERKTPFIIGAMVWGNIVDPYEVAAYCAHVAIESGEFRYVREIHDGSNYEGRRDLGNVYDGDGIRFPGRGDIQLTGRDVARKAGTVLGADFENNPGLMERDEWASLCSAYFWTRYKPWLPYMARRGWFHATQIAVNGGENHFKQRTNFYNLNLSLFNLPLYSGVSDEQTKIRYFQAEKGLVPDGIPGPKTWNALLRS